MMRIHVHLEDGDTPICGILTAHSPNVDEEIIVNVASGVFPNVVLTPYTYKVEKVTYIATEILGEDVPEIHDTILYLPEVVVYVSVVP